MYPATGKSYNEIKSFQGALPGAVVPNGFQHYPHCVCYVPDPNKPKPTLELAEIDMLSE